MQELTKSKIAVEPTLTVDADHAPIALPNYTSEEEDPREVTRLNSAYGNEVAAFPALSA